MELGSISTSRVIVNESIRLTCVQSRPSISSRKLDSRQSFCFDAVIGSVPEPGPSSTVVGCTRTVTWPVALDAASSAGKPVSVISEPVNAASVLTSSW